MIILGIKYLEIGGVKDHSKEQKKQANLRLGQWKKHGVWKKNRNICFFLFKLYGGKPPCMVFGGEIHKGLFILIKYMIGSKRVSIFKWLKMILLVSMFLLMSIYSIV